MTIKTIAMKEQIWPIPQTVKTGQYVSEDEYWAKYYHHPDVNYEWHNGYLEEKPMADYLKAAIYAWFVDILRRYLEVYPIARLTMLEIGFRMVLPHKTSIRKPDLGLVLNNNPIPLADHDRTYKGVFDLCVESLSDSSKEDVERDTVVNFRSIS